MKLGHELRKYVETGITVPSNTPEYQRAYYKLTRVMVASHQALEQQTNDTTESQIAARDTGV